MTERYSNLAPLDHGERAHLCILLCNFFARPNNAKHREALGLKTNENNIRPLRLFDFFMWAQKNGSDLWQKAQQINELVAALERKGALVDAGITGKAASMSRCSTSGIRSQAWLKKERCGLGIS